MIKRLIKALMGDRDDRSARNSVSHAAELHGHGGVGRGTVRPEHRIRLNHSLDTMDRAIAEINATVARLNRMADETDRFIERYCGGALASLQDGQTKETRNGQAETD